MTEISQVKTTKIYKKIIIGFSLIVILTLGFIIYFSFTNTIIVITLQPIEENTIFNVDLKGELSDENQPSEYKLKGTFLSTIIEKRDTFTNTSTGDKIEAQATGTVTIYNNYSKLQPLAATTRLLTPDGILFRIKDRVDVPAGGKIENVEVYADESGIVGNIPASTFTIPGLWPGLQEQIYAESFEPMTRGIVDAKILTQELVAEAVQELKEQVLTEAKQKFLESDEVLNKNYKKIGQALATITVESEVTPAVGEIASEFEIYIKYNVFGIVFDESLLLNVAKVNLSQKLPDDRDIDETESNKLNYIPVTQNFDDQTANLEVTYIAQTKIKNESEIFNKEKLTNKSAEEINKYFSNFEGILNVSTKFSPFWTTKTPNLTDHIILEIH